MPEADWLSGASSGVFDFYGIKRELDASSEIALEMTLRAAFSTCEVVQLTALTFGREESDRMLRTLFALGFDACVRIDGDPDPFSPEKTASLIADYCKSNPGFDLIVLGDQSSDGNNRKTQFLLTEYLGMRAANRVIQFTFTEDRMVRILREIPGGTCEETQALPLVISAGDASGMLLRVPTLMQRKKASDKQIQVVPYEKETAEPSIELTDLEYIDQSRRGEFLQADSPSEAAQILMERFIRGMR